MTPSVLLSRLQTAMAEAYGTPFTEDPCEAGFILPDGQLLRLGMDGSRYSDHREIVGILDAALPLARPEGDGTRTGALRWWMGALGLVRIGVYGLSRSRRGPVELVVDVESASPLTPVQSAVLRSILRSAGSVEARRVRPDGDSIGDVSADVMLGPVIGRVIALLSMPSPETPLVSGRTLRQALLGPVAAGPPRGIAQVPEAEVIATWAKLYAQGKHKGIDPPDMNRLRGMASIWVKVWIPHILQSADWTNPEGELSTEQAQRAAEYAARPGELPPGIALFGGRIKGQTKAYITDGNHRSYAAFLRGEAGAVFFMPLPDWERFREVHRAAEVPPDPEVLSALGLELRALPFVKATLSGDEVGDEEGIYHVTTRWTALLRDGVLKSRAQLSGVMGLGGGWKDEARNQVSATWSRSRAQDLARAMRVMSRAARGEASVTEVLSILDGVQPAIDAREDLLVGDEEEDEDILAGLQRIDDAIAALKATSGADLYDAYVFLEREVMDAWRDSVSLAEVGATAPYGFTAPRARFAQVEPSEIRVLQIAARKNATVDWRLEELEIRFRPEDLQIIGVVDDE